jgi:hypothetical protein
MKIIAHRGNLEGPNPEQENHPDYIDRAITDGFYVEVDVWYDGKQYWLGHDGPQYQFPERYWKHNQERLYCHAKNREAFEQMAQDGVYQYFWHQTDDYTLTSRGVIWVYPRKPILRRSIIVMPELGYQGNLFECYGICTDYALDYRNRLR